MKPTATKLSLMVMPRTVPVFLIEDNRLLRDGLSALLTANGLNVVATARSGKEALREVARVKPQLVLLDSALGDQDSARLVKEVREALPDVKVIVMGLLPAHEDFVEFVKAGASGFILKDATIEVFVATILAVADGVSVLPSLMAGTLFSHVASQALSRGRRGVKAAVRTTARERQVIESIADGMSNREIANRLHIATHTVKSHVHNILEKLALHTRLEVAIYAHDQERALISG
ncbi:MAG: response regulator transcription factor [Gemmatimonadales bacterium]